MVRLHPAKIGGHRHCGSKNIVLVCHAILQDHVFKQLYEFMSWSLSCFMVSHHPAKFDDHRHLD